MVRARAAWRAWPPRAVRHPELGVDVLDVVADGLGADPELAGDPLVGHPWARRASTSLSRVVSPAGPPARGGSPVPGGREHRVGRRVEPSSSASARSSRAASARSADRGGGGAGSSRGRRRRPPAGAPGSRASSRRRRGGSPSRPCARGASPPAGRSGAAARAG